VCCAPSASQRGDIQQHVYILHAPEHRPRHGPAVQQLSGRRRPAQQPKLYPQAGAAVVPALDVL
ncbi:hypothetical protein H4R21_006961, partial [Coemansia helicoidea]